MTERIIDAAWLDLIMEMTRRDLIGRRIDASLWTLVSHAQKLVWIYGPERALSILQGTDAPTNVDVAAWRKLGRREMAA